MSFTTLMEAFSEVKKAPHPLPVGTLLSCTPQQRSASFFMYGEAYKARYCPTGINDAVYPVHWGSTDRGRMIGWALSEMNAFRGWSVLLKFIAEKALYVPGVYMFFDRHERLLYVGKACSVKTRLLQHLRGRRSMRARKQILQLTHQVRAYYADDGEDIFESEADLIDAYNPPGNAKKFLGIESWRTFAEDQRMTRNNTTYRPYRNVAQGPKGRGGNGEPDRNGE